jgi:hypothetical protein
MRVAAHPPNQRVSIKQTSHRRSLPTFEFFGRQRLKELRADFDFSLPGAGLAVSDFILDRYQFYNWLFAACDDDLFSTAGLLDEAGELGLGFVDGDRFHD